MCVCVRLIQEEEGDYTYVERVQVPLSHGTLLLMSGSTQEDWQVGSTNHTPASLISRSSRGEAEAPRKSAIRPQLATTLATTLHFFQCFSASVCGSGVNPASGGLWFCLNRSEPAVRER